MYIYIYIYIIELQVIENINTLYKCVFIEVYYRT